MRLKKNLEQQIAEKKRLREEKLDIKRINTCIDQSERLNVSEIDLGKTPDQKTEGLKQIVEQYSEVDKDEFNIMQFQIEVYISVIIDFK